jgi:hypothetical protein
MILKMRNNLPVILTILIFASLALVSGCRTAQPILQSVIVRDTLVVTEARYLIDTLEVYKDTVIYRDNVRIQTKYVDRKLVVEAMCDPDTVRITQTKILTKQEEKRKGWNFDQMVLGAILILTILYFFKRWVDKLTE